MTQEGFKLKLTAILSADVIEYSRPMRDDEESTFRLLFSAFRIRHSEFFSYNHFNQARTGLTQSRPQFFC